jgi:hypothetical protein
MQASQVRSGSHKILLPSRRPRRITDEETGRDLLVRYRLGEDVYHGTVCGVCLGCVKQGKEIQFTGYSVEYKNGLMPAFECASAPGTVVDCNVTNIRAYRCTIMLTNMEQPHLLSHS